MVILSLLLPIRLHVASHISLPRLAISILTFSIKPVDFFHDAANRCSLEVKLFRLNRVVKTHVDLGSVLDTHANGEVMRAENVVRELLGLIANCVGLC